MQLTSEKSCGQRSEMEGAAEGAGLPASDRNPAIVRLPFMFVTLSTISVNRRGPLSMLCAELGINGLKSSGRNWYRKVRETRSSSSQKRSERGQEVLAAR